MRPGSPAMYDGIVSTSERYIASGSAAFSPSLNATVGDVGETITSKCSNAAACSRDQRPHLLRLAVVRVVVAGRERVRAEHDPALRLVAEAVVARALDHLAVGRRRRRGGRSGRRRSGPGSRTPRPARSGSSRRARTRPSAAARTRRPRRRARAASSIASSTAAVTPGSIPSASFISFGTPIRRPSRSSPSGSSTGRHVDGRRVAPCPGRR